MLYSFTVSKITPGGDIPFPDEAMYEHTQRSISL
jgi:hypothetical protein